MKKDNQFQPKKVQRIVCPKCGELQIKIYPWASFSILNPKKIPSCKKCLKKVAP